MEEPIKRFVAALSLAASTATTVAQTPPAPSAPATVAPLAIQHQELRCVVAGQHPKLDACFDPAANVARAQVHFRAVQTDPWYSVELRPAGACLSALLPKPKREIQSFQYFIYAVDRGFEPAHKPEAAPGASFDPRVVGKEIECQNVGALVAWAARSPRPIVIGVARNPAGTVLDATAAGALKGQAPLTGFSTEGVVFGSGEVQATTEDGSAGKRKGVGTGTLAVLGGLGAAAAVGVAAGGGGSDGAGGRTDSSGPSPLPTTNLTGRWVGNVANGNGQVTETSAAGLQCTDRRDLIIDLTQSGSSLSGRGSSTAIGGSFSCNFPTPGIEQLSAISGQAGSGTLSGSVGAGTLSFRAGEFDFTGTFTSNTIEALSTKVIDGMTFRITWRLVR